MTNEALNYIISDASGFGRFASRLHRHNSSFNVLRAQNCELVLVRVGGLHFKYSIIVVDLASEQV